jgi:hypothetical protein
MARLPGSIRIQLIPELKQYVSGYTFTSTFSSRSFDTKESRYRPILGELKKIDGVKDVWFTDDKETDLFVEIEASGPEEGRNIESTIKNIPGVKNTELNMSTLEIQQ